MPLVRRSLRNRRPGRTDWARLDRMKGEDIDFSDIPETDAKFWAEARVVFPGRKVPVTLRLDPDIVAWFKRGGPGYQSRINAVLRTFVDARKTERVAPRR